MMPKKVLLAYVPVPHRGYLEFFKRHSDAEAIYVFGPGLIAEFGHLRKDLRANTPEEVRQMLWGLGYFGTVRIAEEETLLKLTENRVTVVMPDEDECRTVAERYLRGSTVEFDRSVFLRWDRKSILAKNEVKPDRVVQFEGFVAEMMQRAFSEAERATNLWRRVGAVIVRDGEILLVAHNTQVPSPHTPYYEGDPRMFSKQGLHFELTTDEHAEARLVGEAAGEGIALKGAHLYVTTFPCPPCAKLVARVGFRRLYFAEGYAVLDSERILRDSGVEIIQVELKPPDS